MNLNYSGDMVNLVTHQKHYVSNSKLIVPEGHTKSADRTFSAEIHNAFRAFRVISKNRDYRIYVVYRTRATRIRPLNEEDHLTFFLQDVEHINILRNSKGQMFTVEIEFINDESQIVPYSAPTLSDFNWINGRDNY